MKAITLIQPWASLVADGWKRVETRSWPTNYRGPIAIHAGKTPAIEGIGAVLELLEGGPRDDDLRRYLFSTVWPLGCVVCTANIVDCVRLEPDGWTPDDTERILGHYAPDRYAWILDDVVKLEKPIPARGQQGFWEWEGSDGYAI